MARVARDMGIVVVRVPPEQRGAWREVLGIEGILPRGPVRALVQRPIFVDRHGVGLRRMGYPEKN